MIAEILPEAYDIWGKRLRDPGQKRFKFFLPKYPLGRQIKDPLRIRCRDLKEIRNFLKTCRYVSDLKQFGVEDYWMPPELFEQRRQGDCEDFALWVWRQLIVMGKKEPRFVTGILQPDHREHAWVTFMEGCRGFLIEATAPRLSRWLPRLRTAKYVPVISVAWGEGDLVYYEHTPRRFKPSLVKLFFLEIERLFFWLKTRPRYCHGWIRYWLYLAYHRPIQTKPAFHP